jgi:hypothetical protein
MDRGNHYEGAFEAYLRDRGVSYIPVDETRRPQTDHGPLKCLDFIVFGPADSRLLVDVKGRRFPGGTAERPRRVWECWSTEEDVLGLERWAERSGPGFRGLLVFAYSLAAAVDLPADTDDLWTWRDQRYLFRAVDASEYRRHMRVRSPKWGTVGLPGAEFRRLVRPLHHFTHGYEPAVDSEEVSRR